MIDYILPVANVKRDYYKSQLIAFDDHGTAAGAGRWSGEEF